MYPLKIQEKYDQNNLVNLWHRFTTLYLWNYIAWDMREWVWSHCWVDIMPPSPESDVLSVLDWEVIKCWEEDSAYGKYIVIKHIDMPDIQDKSKKINLYSSYLHLSSLDISVWDKLKEWQIIWKTWNTGMSFWEHLHFQIDRDALFHPYWPFTWADSREAWLSFLESVNEWLWLKEAKKYTVNPLVYLDFYDQYRKTSDVEEISEIVDTPLVSDSVDREIDIVDTREDLIVSWDDTSILSSSTIIIDTSVVDISADDPSDTRSDRETLIRDESIESLASTDTSTLLASSVDTSILDSERSSIESFSDIDSSDKLASYLSYLKEKWIIKWYADGTFRWSNPITRAELLKMLFSITNQEISDNNNDFFDDVTWTVWYKKYVNTAVERWIISTNNKNFRPNSYISRSEALKILIKWNNINPEEIYTQNYKDVNESDWFAKYVDYACKNNLLLIESDYFYPNKDISRREVVEVLKKLDNSSSSLLLA